MLTRWWMRSGDYVEQGTVELILLREMLPTTGQRRRCRAAVGAFVAFVAALVPLVG